MLLLKTIMDKVINNDVLQIALISLVIAQICKFIIYYIKEKHINFRHLVSAGGMPSSHTAMVCGLSTAIGLHIGWDSPLFALSCICAAIVMYDASGVRRAAGRQARILNQMLDEFFNKGKFPSDKLSELIGHTPFEVFAGMILGILVAFVFY